MMNGDDHNHQKSQVPESSPLARWLCGCDCLSTRRRNYCHWQRRQIYEGGKARLNFRNWKSKFELGYRKLLIKAKNLI